VSRVVITDGRTGEVLHDAPGDVDKALEVVTQCAERNGYGPMRLRIFTGAGVCVVDQLFVRPSQ